MKNAHADQAMLLRYRTADLTGKEAASVRRHVSGCAECRRSLEFTTRLGHALRSRRPELHEVLSTQGSLPATDPFAVRPRSRRPLARELGLDAKRLAREAAKASEAARAKRDRLLKVARTGGPLLVEALGSVRLDTLSGRFALSYLLEEAREIAGELPEDGRELAKAALGCLTSKRSDLRRAENESTEHVLPFVDIFGLAYLLAGVGEMRRRGYEAARLCLEDSWRSFGEGRGGDYRLAAVELCESERRSIQGRPEEGLVLAERAARTFSEHGLKNHQARAHAARGSALYCLGRFKESLEAFNSSLAVFEKLKEWKEYADTLGNAAASLGALGSRSGIAKLCREAPRPSTRFGTRGSFEWLWLITCVTRKASPLVTDKHPAELALLGLVSGRPDADPEAAAEMHRHLETGCALCERRVKGLKRLVHAVKEESAFQKTFNETPASQPTKIRSGEMSVVTAIGKPRRPLEDIYRLSRAANEPAAAIVEAAKVSVEEAESVIRSLDGDPRRSFALLYASQKGIAVVLAEPLRMLDLSDLLLEEALTLLQARMDARTPTSRELVEAEALLLRSYAHLQLGHYVESREAAGAAREAFDQGADAGLGRAFCDYYEGQAAYQSHDFVDGQKLLRKALKVFAEFGQDRLVTRANGCLGTLFLARGDAARALQYLDPVVDQMDESVEAHVAVAAHQNRGAALARLGRFDEARASYARSLAIARKSELNLQMHITRNGLAELDFRRGQYQRALNAFSVLANDALVAGYDVDHVFARLYVSECLGRLGFAERMADEVASLRQDKKAHPFAASPAMEELFACLDQGAIDADLVGHVRQYLEDTENGIQRPYRRLRLVG